MSCFRALKLVWENFSTNAGKDLYTGNEKDWLDQARGGIDVDTEACTLCGKCADGCPVSAITVSDEAGTWEINRMQCIQCGECVMLCSEDCLVMGNLYIDPENVKVMDVFDVEK